MNCNSCITLRIQKIYIKYYKSPELSLIINETSNSRASRIKKTWPL